MKFFVKIFGRQSTPVNLETDINNFLDKLADTWAKDGTSVHDIKYSSQDGYYSALIIYKSNRR